MTFAARLREICEFVGLNQTQLATRSGIPRCTLRKWMNGTCEPTFSGVVRLCRALRVELVAFQECEPVRSGGGRIRRD